MAQISEADPELALVSPELIRCKETYSYQVEISANPDVTLAYQKPPSGIIQIDIPYDGGKCFPVEESKRLIKKYPEADRPAAVKAGWLAIAPSLDWEHDWTRPVGAQIYPVQIPIKDPRLSTDQKFWSNEFNSVTRHTYRPAAPPFLPISMDLQVYDDESTPLENFQDYLSMYRAGEHQEGQMVIDLSINAHLPAILAHEKTRVVLDFLQLNWPTIAPPWQLDLQQLDEKNVAVVPWRYNPQTNAVEVCGLDFYRGVRETGSPLVPFQTRLRLILKIPGQVISHDELSGSAVIKIDGLLLSGQRFQWMFANGARCPDEKLIQQETVIDASFVALLSDQFRRRQTSSYREWYFPGVELTDARLSGMAAALRDQGYQILTQKLEDGKGTIVGRRSANLVNGEVTPMQVEILMEYANSSGTSRERRVAGELLFRSNFKTSDLIVRVRGRVRGAGSLMANDMEQLMTTLDGRFNAVAELR